MNVKVRVRQCESVVDWIWSVLPALSQTHGATGADCRGQLSIGDRDGSLARSVFTVLIEEVLKNPGKLSVGRSLEAEREGGRVKFPSGRLHLYKVAEQDMPRVGSRCVLFLAETNTESVYEIVTGHELRGPTVYALDDLPKTTAYKNRRTTSLLDELKMKLA